MKSYELILLYALCSPYFQAIALEKCLISYIFVNIRIILTI